MYLGAHVDVNSDELSGIFYNEKDAAENLSRNVGIYMNSGHDLSEQMLSGH